MGTPEHNAHMREESGRFASERELVSFFYELMRDHLPPGKVEEIVQHVLNEEGNPVAYTNGWLARYANYIVQRLTQ